MKKFNEEVIEAARKDHGKIGTAVGKVKQFGKDHWKGLTVGGVATGAGMFIKKRFFPRQSDTVDYEQDTIDGAKEDFGIDYSESNLEAGNVEVDSE